jgi:hypothetical protein
VILNRFVGSTYGIDCWVLIYGWADDFWVGELIYGWADDFWVDGMI